MDSKFLKIFGKSPITKVLDFLVVHDAFDYSMVEIARHSKVSYATLKVIWPHFENKRIVVLIRKVGKAKMYQLNNKNEFVKHFKKFYWDITKREVHKDLEIPTKPLNKQPKTSKR